MTMPKGAGRAAKKSKASKTYFNPITLIEGESPEIGETVRDITAETLQQFVEEH